MRRVLVLLIVVAVGGCTPGPTGSDAGVFLAADGGAWRADWWRTGPGPVFDETADGVVVAYGETALDACVPGANTLNVVVLTRDLQQRHATSFADGGVLQVATVSAAGDRVAVAATRFLSTGSSAAIVVLDAALNLVWTRDIDGADDDRLARVKVLSDGRIAFAGTTRSMLDRAPAGEDVFVGVYAASGVLEWRRQLGSAGDDGVRGMVITDDGLFVLVFAPTQFGPAVSANGLYVVNFSLAGEEQSITPLDLQGDASLFVIDGDLVALGRNEQTVSIQRRPRGSASWSMPTSTAVSCPAPTSSLAFVHPWVDSTLIAACNQSPRGDGLAAHFAANGTLIDSRRLPADRGTPQIGDNITSIELRPSDAGVLVLSWSSRTDACAGSHARLGLTRL